jgi:Flp pilus assembly protein TadD
LFLACFCFVNAVGQKQPSQAELNKMMKEAEQMAEKMMKDPRYKEAMSQSADIDEETGLAWGKLPQRNAAKLVTIPKSIFTVAELKSFVAGLNKKLDTKLSSTTAKQVSKILSENNNDALTISRTAVAAWYNRNHELAIALAIKAADVNSDNAEVLNTLGSILNLTGNEVKAVPVLQFLNNKIPGNTTILNNLGQAWLGVGEIQKAESFLLMCVGKSPTHAQANKSLGIIYQATGQTAKAKQCFLQSLKGAYSITSVAGTHKVGIEDEEIDQVIIKNHKAKEYFNSYKYQLPPLCENIKDAVALKQKHDDFRKFLEDQKDKYRELGKVEGEKIKKEAALLQSSVQQGKVVRIQPSPMTKLAERTYNYWMTEYAKFMNAEYYPAIVRLSKQQDELRIAYEEEYKKINTSDASNKCELFDALANKYLPKYAALQRDFIGRTLAAQRGYVDEFIYWSQFMNTIGQGRSMVYSQVIGYFDFLKELSKQTKFIEPACTHETSPTFPAIPAEPIDVNCPFKLNFKFGVGKIAFSCDKFEIEVSAGVIAGYEKDFTTKESTLAIGIGTPSLEFIPDAIKIPELEKGIIKGSAEAKEQVYVTFDGEGNPTDIGLKFEAGVSVEVGSEEGAGFEFEAKSGYTMGLNSGWNFETGSLGISKDLLN